MERAIHDRAFLCKDVSELNSYSARTGRGLFLNVGTLEIYCFHCNIEILDENLRAPSDGSQQKSIAPFKSIVKLVFTAAILDVFSRSL